MKIVVLSVHSFDGIGSLTRIKLIISNLANIYGRENIEWVNLVPFGWRTKGILKNRRLYTSDIKYIKYLPWFLFPKLNSLSFWFLKKYIQTWLAWRYSNDGTLMWLEMSPSYEVFGSYFKNNKKVPLIIDIHGTIDEFLLSPQKDDRLFNNYSKAVFNEVSGIFRANGIVTVSNKMFQIYKSRYCLKDTINVTIPTIPDNELFEYSLETRLKFRKKLSIENNFVFVYSGGISKWQCIEETLLLFDKIRNNQQFKALNPILFMLVWDNKFSLKEKLEKLNIFSENIFVYNLKQNEVGDYLQACDAGIILRDNLSTNLVASPTKIAEYYSSGLPIITTKFVGDISEMVKKNENLGYIVDLDQYNDINSLLKWCNFVEENKEMIVEECANFVSDYYGVHNYEKLRTIIDKVLYNNEAKPK